jgi:hypothetical protein
MSAPSGSGNTRATRAFGEFGADLALPANIRPTQELGCPAHPSRTSARGAPTNLITASQMDSGQEEAD